MNESETTAMPVGVVDDESLLEGMYQVILHNDDHNSMDHIVASLGKVFGHAPQLAEKIMMEAHGRGSAVAEVEAESPAKLHRDQLQSLRSWTEALGNDSGREVAAHDGDTPSAERRRIRHEARWVLTNPDMLHLGILPNHAQWARFLAGLRLVVLDEVHVYRGVFGSHVAHADYTDRSGGVALQ